MRLSPAKICRTLLLVVLGIFVVVIVRALTSQSLQMHPSECQRTVDHDYLTVTEERLERFQGMIRQKSISFAEKRGNITGYVGVIEHIKQSFPFIHDTKSPVERYLVANTSLVYRLQGSDASLKPALLCAHIDVVPIANPSAWEHDPFEASIHDTFIYGRGALDDKARLTGILEALEHILKTNGFNYRPKRTIILAFGHDEEVGGLHGAGMLAEFMIQRNWIPEFLLDEGMPIFDNVLGVDRPIALIGTSEKGYLTIKLTVEMDKDTAGHSSRPPREQAISILAQALSRIHDNPFPAHINDALRDMLTHIAPELPFVRRLIMCNLWLFEPIAKVIIGLKSDIDALQRTTVAMSMIEGGVKENVLPHVVSATINHRISPGESVASVIERDIAVINDKRVQVSVVQAFEPIDASPCDNIGFKVLEKSVRQIWPKYYVVPALMIAGTDTKHYSHLTKNMYRFLPVVLGHDDISRIHGPNERISLEAYEKLLNFYIHLLHNIDSYHETPNHHHTLTDL